MIHVELRKYNLPLLLLLYLGPFKPFCRQLGPEYVARLDHRESTSFPSRIVTTISGTRLMIRDKTLNSLWCLLTHLLLLLLLFIVHDRAQPSNKGWLLNDLQHVLKRSRCLGKQSRLNPVQIVLVNEGLFGGVSPQGSGLSGGCRGRASSTSTALDPSVLSLKESWLLLHLLG